MLLREEKIGLKGFISKLVFGLLLLSNYNLFPQTNINGFCKFEISEVRKNFSGIIPFAQKSKSFGSYLLIDYKTKKVILVNNTEGSRVYSTTINLPYVVTDLSPISNKRSAAFISRKNMKAGILSIHDDKASINKEYTLTSYPEHIDNADINEDKQEDLLVSGSAYGGISLLTADGNNFKENKISSDQLYSNAIFTQVNNDGYPDIAGLNILKNCIDIFYNRGNGTFYYVRSFNCNFKINNFGTAYIDNDNFNDFYLYGNNKINIIYGDAVSAYKNRGNLETKYPIDKVSALDLNGDNISDFVYLNKENNYSGIIFSGSAYTEIFYLNQKKLQDFSLQSSLQELVFLSGDGNLYKFSHQSSFNENYSVHIGGSPTGLTWFDLNIDKQIDVCYFDRADKKIKFLIKSAKGIYKRYYEYQLYHDLEEIYTVRNSASIKTFYCYSLNKKLIEIIKVDFEKNKFDRTSIYAKGNIVEIRAGKNSDRVYLVYKLNEKFYTAIIEKRQNRYTISNENYLDENILDESISFSQNRISYYYMTTEPNVVSIKKKFNDSTEVLKTININNPVNGYSVIGDFFGKNDVAINVSGKGNVGVMAVTSDSTYIIDTLTILRFLPIKLKKNLYYFKDDSLSTIYFYNVKDKTLGKLYFADYRSIVVNEFVSGLNIDYFFVYRLRKNISYIVYSDPVKNCITFKQII